MIKNTCCLCGNKNNLIQHAIDYNDDNLSANNTIILCKNCHQWVHEKPEYREECARLLYKYLEEQSG